jgi:hypothetical protein
MCDFNTSFSHSLDASMLLQNRVSNIFSLKIEERSSSPAAEAAADDDKIVSLCDLRFCKYQ